MTLEINETELFKSLQQSLRLPGSDSPLDIKSDYHPSDGQLALLANHAYSSLEDTTPNGWGVLATATAGNGYDGKLYWHAEKRQVVIAHRGTEPPLPQDNSEQAIPQRYWFNAFGRAYDYVEDKVQSAKKQLERAVPTVRDLSTDFFGVAQGAEVSQIESSLDFTQRVLKKLSGVDVLSFSVTGHSLGGWLAQLTTYEARFGGLVADNVGYSLDLHCVVFDSPGAMNILEANEQTMADDFKADLNTQLDITTYLSAPNLVNTCNAHVGTLYRIFPDFSDIDRSTIKGWGSYLLHAHTMDNFCRFFSETDAGFPSELKQVKKWPQVDWTKMEITKGSAVHALFRVFANLSTGVESLAATLANVDYQQFEVVQQFCRVDDEQEAHIFSDLNSMVRKGHYSLGKLEQNNTVTIPLRAFGVDIHNVLTGFNAYSALVKSGLLDREDEALVGLTSLKVSLETRLGADSLRVLAALAPYCSLDGQALVLNTDSANVFSITQDNMHEPAWLRRLQYQSVQVVKQIFLAYPDLSIALHETYLGVPSDILDAHQMLKDAFERLELELQKFVAEAAMSKNSPANFIYHIDRTVNVKAGARVNRVESRIASLSNVAPDKADDAFKHVQTMADKGIKSAVNAERGSVIGTISDDIGNIDFAASTSVASASPVTTEPAQSKLLGLLGMYTPKGESTYNRVFRRKARDYIKTLSNESDEDVCEVKVELETLIDNIDVKNMSKQGRDEIREKMKEMEQILAEVEKETLSM